MAVEWFYDRAGFRRGPVTPAALKQLADSGEITPETRIWREGLSDWAKAGAVRGLFAAASPSQPASQSPVKSEPVTSQSPAAPPAAVVSPPPLAEPPRVTLQEHGWHPFDGLIAMVREACPSELPAQVSGLAGKAGIYALYVAAALVLLGGLLVAMKSNRLTPIALSFAGSVGLLVLQYASQRLLTASDSAIRGNASFLGSYAVPDSAFVITVASTVAGALWLLGMAVSGGTLTPAIAAIMLLVVGVFTAMVCIQPPGISVLIKPHCQAGEEALGVFTFFVKVFLRCAPIAFAAAMFYVDYKAVESLWAILRADDQSLWVMTLRGFATAGQVFAAAAIPIYAYVVTLAYYLTIDMLSAIVSLPAKIDAVNETLHRERAGQ